MAYEIKPNSGSLFKNDKRETEQHPNATGTVLIDGVEWWCSAWTKTTKTGDKWQSLSFKRKEKKAPQMEPLERNAYAERDEDPPF